MDLWWIEREFCELVEVFLSLLERSEVKGRAKHPRRNFLKITQSLEFLTYSAEGISQTVG